MIKNYLIIVLLILGFNVHGQYSWLNKDTLPSAGRFQSVGFSIGNTGYLVGGWTQYPSVTVNEVWAYNPSTDAWTQKNSYPAGASDGASFVINDSAYIIGGYIGGGTYSSTNYFYNATNDSWSSKSSFPGGAVGGAFHFVINGLGYVGAGKRGSANTSNTVYSYSSSSDNWTSVAAFPESVVDPIGFAIDSFGYAGLGSDGGTHTSSNFYKYSPVSNTWAPIASFPGGARSSTMCFVIDGKAYVGGGYAVSPSNSSVTYDLGDFYSYDPSNDSWTLVPGIPGRGRHGASSFNINSNGYIVGGYDGFISQTLSKVAEFGTCSQITGIMPVPGGNNKSGIEIYPNPSSYDVNVKIDASITTEIKYEVVSVDGKLIRSGSTNQNTFGFNAANLSNGVYLLTITDNQGVQGTERFEVIH